MGFNFKLNRNDFLKVLNTQQAIVNKKGNMAILSYMLIESGENELLCTVTDLEIGLRQCLSAEILSPGSILLPAKKLFELVRVSDAQELHFKETEKFWVDIVAGTSSYKLAGMEVTSFPSILYYDETPVVEIAADIFIEMVNKTSFCFAQDNESMFTLTSSLLEKNEENNSYFFKITTSDSHRLAIVKKEIDESINTIKFKKYTLIPKKGVQEIKKFCDLKEKIFFGIKDKEMFLKKEKEILTIRLMEGEFPNFDTIIEKKEQKFNFFVNRVLFLEALKRINIFTEDFFHPIKIEVSKNKIILYSQNIEYGSARDEFEIEYDDQEITLFFNCRFIIDVLQVMEAENIKISIEDEKGPCTITSDEDEGFVSVIMPMNI